MKTPDPPCADTDMYDSDVSLDQEVVDIDVCDASSSLSGMEGTDVDNGPQCNCGADSRAHKRNCPLNSRYCTMSSPSCNQTSFISVGAHTPPATQVKPTLKVGDSVCFHRSFFGGQHAVCRIVRDFGAQHQLFCSLGIISTPISEVELVPLNDCSISLDAWRQAPMVSLRSLITDPSCLELCNCSLPTIPDIIKLKSPDGESTGSDMWVKNALYSLTRASQSEVTSPTGWLSDEVITAAQLLLLQYFPTMAGLQPPTLQQTCAFQVHSGEFVQIIHVRNNHWCVVSTVGCKTGEVNMYDSLCGNLSFETKLLIASMISCVSLSELTVRVVNVDRQKNGSDCGVLAIAYAFDICSGLDPCTVKFDHKSIRQHLTACLEKCQFSRFPVLGERRKGRGKAIHVELHCSCRLPVREGAEEMAQCDTCHIWYHHHCMDIPSIMFGDVEVPWVCKTCC